MRHKDPELMQRIHDFAEEFYLANVAKSLLQLCEAGGFCNKDLNKIRPTGARPLCAVSP